MFVTFLKSSGSGGAARYSDNTLRHLYSMNSNREHGKTTNSNASPVGSMWQNCSVFQALKDTKQGHFLVCPLASLWGRNMTTNGQIPEMGISTVLEV